MNRVGFVVDIVSSIDQHCAIDASSRPISDYHANPSWWHPARRTFGDDVIKPLVARGGMVGFRFIRTIFRVIRPYNGPAKWLRTPSRHGARKFDRQ
jgi:microsomal dipeptidase-like Zn-dependent dipeptidase